MKRIVIDGIIFGLQKAGGISRMWSEILLDLDKNKDFETYLLLPPTRNVEWAAIKDQLTRIRVIPRKDYRRWEVRGIPIDTLYLSWMALRLRANLWHTTYYTGVPFGLMPKFATLYDMIPEVLGFRNGRDTETKMRVCKRINHLVAISECSKRDFRTLWPTMKATCEVVYVSFSPRPMYQKGTSEPYLAFVGTRKGYKNFLPACQALLKDPRFASYKIYVVGGEEKLEKEIREEERIVHLPLLPHEEVEKIIAGSSAVLYPSLYEGFGMPIVEAFQQGVLVLANRSSSIPEVTGEEYPLADANNLKTLGDTLERLLQEKGRWIAHGEERAKLFESERILPKLYKLYEDALR